MSLVMRSQGEKGPRGRRNSLGKAQSGEFLPSDRELRENLDGKVLGWKTAVSMYHWDSNNMKSFYSWPGPSFLKPHTVSAENTLHTFQQIGDLFPQRKLGFGIRKHHKWAKDTGSSHKRKYG